MPTLRQKVDAFCKEAGSKVSDSDKLRNQVGMLKQELKKAKDTHKHHMHLLKAASKTAKVAKPAKAPKAPTAPKAPKVKQEVSMNPVPAAMPQTATVASAGRRTRRRRL
jgi:hypothetical protein